MVQLSVCGSTTHVSKNEKNKQILDIEQPGWSYLFIHESTTLVIVFRGGRNAPYSTDQNSCERANHNMMKIDGIPSFKAFGNVFP